MKIKTFAKEKRTSSDAIQRLLAFGALIIIFIFFSIASPYFFTFSNVVGILIATAVNGLLALGVTQRRIAEKFKTTTGNLRNYMAKHGFHIEL